MLTFQATGRYLALVPSEIAQKAKPLRGTGPSVQAWALPHLIACVEARGFDAARIRAIPWLANLDDPDSRVPEVAAEAAWRTAVAITNDDALGIHVAESLPRGAIDLVEYAFRSSPSLTAGIERIARYGRLLSDRLTIRIEPGEHGVLILIRDAFDTVAHPARTEFGLATILRLARETTGVGITPQEVCFAHPAPPNAAEHTRFFGRRVRFNAGSNSMILTAEDAARPLQGADAALADIVRRRLDKGLASREAPDGRGFTAQVRRLMVEELGQRSLTPDAVANALNVSRRTLSRRLAEEGTSFREQIDDVRAHFARALLHDRSLSIADIAFFLQYAEPTAFHRSFRRWTGKTPLAYRAGG